MVISDGHLLLFEPNEKQGLRLPIDEFFISLANDQKEKSIGIILSGMGSDGSNGIKAIKENQGIVIVEDPLTSKFDGMPKSAIASVNVDVIAPVKELPSQLLSLLQNRPAVKRSLQTEDKNKTNLEKIIILIHSHTGHDFSLYKNSTLYRRIERRMGIHQLDKISSYVTYLQENPAELVILFKELLIGVTSFFRDPKVWNKLKEEVLPEFFKGLPDGYKIRVWITGCSTGEEAYSFAMIYKEAYEKFNNDKNLTLQIFATDIDIDAIDRARKGVFALKIAEEVSPERLRRFFTKKGSNYIINTSIREMMVFAAQDVTKDPPFSKLDFLLCRNLLIYLVPELQKKLINLFIYSLNSEGIMVLGSAESINTKESLFKVIDKKLKIYKRNKTVLDIDRMDFSHSISHLEKQNQAEDKTMKDDNNIQNFADQLLLQQFAPASVLINKEGDILYITGKTGKYLEPAAGRANMNVFAMAREGLGIKLLSAVRKSNERSEKIILRNVKISDNEVNYFVDVTIQPIEKPDEYKETLMIVFSDVIAQSEPSEPSKKSKPSEPIPPEKYAQLEIELQHALSELQTAREEMQALREEGTSSNEELQSTNEELQSTNEELTTSKEEMQSMNEELQTVNSELRSKVAKYKEVHNDMENLLNSTDIATLFIDKEFNIRRFTNQITKIFKIRESDIGRPFTEIVSDLNYPEISEHANEVLKKLIPRESEINTKDKRWYVVRIMPYRTNDDRINGLVITFINITEAKKLESELNEKIKLQKKHNLDKS